MSGTSKWLSMKNRLTLAVLVVILFTGGLILRSHKSPPSYLLVASPRFPPFSSDPLDIDAMVHHIAFTSVYSTLVSNYKQGELKGLIAESWSHSVDYKQWTFIIRKGLTFENGEAIDALIVYKNFLRIAYKMKASESESGFIEFLSGIDEMSAANHSFAGLQLGPNSISFSFTKPIPKLVSLIGFGLYSIVSPSMFDEISGDWKDKHQINASGAYSLLIWNNDEITLKLRQSYPIDLRHPHAFQTIKIVSDSDTRQLQEPHLTIGFSDQLPPVPNARFHGPVNSVIRHIRCFHWNDPKHIFYSKSNRQNFRDMIYKEMENLGSKVTRSFLPLQIRGVEAFLSPESLSSFTKLNIKVPMGMQVHDSSATRLPIQKHFVSALTKVADNSLGQIKYVEETPPLRPDVSSADVRLMLTDILIDSPSEDLRFMFLSKHGIRLPDPTGKISHLVRKSDFDINQVNAQIWEDAIIWPVSHVALGFWFNPDLKIDFSKYNATISPADFRWIGLED